MWQILLTLPTLALATRQSNIQARKDAAEPLNKLVARAPSAGYNADGTTWYSSDSPFLILDGGVNFHFQTDGNIVTYDSSSNVLWTSLTGGRSCPAGACKLVFQGDGNFVAYGSDGKAYWSTATNAFPVHEIPAAGLFLRNTAPYIQLYSHEIDLMWETRGQTGATARNPYFQVSHGGGGKAPPLPCSTGDSTKCMVCAADCPGIIYWTEQAYTWGDTDSDGNVGGASGCGAKRSLWSRWLGPRICTDPGGD